MPVLPLLPALLPFLLSDSVVSVVHRPRAAVARLEKADESLAGAFTVGLGAATVRYQGDAGSGFGLAGRGFARWTPTEHLGVRATGQFADLEEASSSVRSRLLQGGLDLMAFAGSGAVRPYLAAGAGLASVQAMVDPFGASPRARDAWIWLAPVEAGVEVRLADGFSVFAWGETVAWSSDGDRLDGIVAGTGSWLQRRDEMVRVGAGIATSLRPRADLDRDGVADRFDACPEVAEDRDGFQDADGCPDPDNDGDGVPDLRDGCPLVPEDRDGFEDDDGCPDLDDDRDGIPDAQDRCPAAAEDRDGFEDADGCPDLDDDRDGIPDAQDRCPAAAEDRDGFEDDDGCPDLDNDRDEIPDALDACPIEPEDRDGFRDADGCPDPDNDRDGIPDAQDLCPDAPETVDGRADADGCPELPLKPGQSMVLDESSLFTGVGAEFAPGAQALLAKIAEQILSEPGSVFEVRGFLDDSHPGEAGRELSTLRAEAVRGVLLARGVEPSRLAARGLGAAAPLTVGATPAERARNRRVELFRTR